MSNYNFGAAYIMNSPNTSVDDAMGSDKLYREGLEFDTKTAQGVLTEDMPKKQSKTTLAGSIMRLAEERDY